MSHRAKKKIRLGKICRYANDGKESRNDDDVENQQFSCLTEHTHSRKAGKRERERERGNLCVCGWIGGKSVAFANGGKEHTKGWDDAAAPVALATRASIDFVCPPPPSLSAPSIVRSPRTVSILKISNKKIGEGRKERS